MTHYTVLKMQDLQSILGQYGIEKVLSKKVLSGGSENTNYLINTPTKSFVLTICEQKSLKKTTELANLLMYLNQNDFTTSKIIKTTEGALTTQWNQKSVMLKDYIDGEIIEDLSDNLLSYLGQELAKLHQIKAPNYLPNSVSYGFQRFDELQHNTADSTFHKWLVKTKIYIENKISADLPKALIHSDIFHNNIIVSKDNKQATIMDFEEACYYYRVFDIGMMIVGTCRTEGNVNYKKVTSLLSGYQQKIKLLEIERKALKAFVIYAATATGFWRYQNFNYINVIPEMKNHFFEMQQLADNIMKLPDNCFI